ncbi:hypothetical protein MPER_04161, partial [Moniliophthora perniciosa FA553]
MTEDHSLSGGVIAGLAAVGGIVLLALVVLIFGFIAQRKARRLGYTKIDGGGVTVEWSNVSYVIPGASGRTWFKKGGRTFPMTSHFDA